MNYNEFIDLNFKHLDEISNKINNGIITCKLEVTKELNYNSKNDFDELLTNYKSVFHDLLLSNNQNVDTINERLFNKLFEFTVKFADIKSNLISKEKFELERIFKNILKFIEWFLFEFYVKIEKNSLRNYDRLISIHEIHFKNINIGIVEKRISEVNENHFQLFMAFHFNKAKYEIKQRQYENNFELIKAKIINKIDELNKTIDEIEINLRHKSNGKIKYQFYGSIHYLLEFFRWFIKEFEVNNLKTQTIIDTSQDLPEIDLTTQKEQIRLLYDLGVIEFLQNKYPATLKNNNNANAHLISQILKLKRDTNKSIQPNVNALLNDMHGDKYPYETKNTKSIIDQLNANELK